MKKIMKAIRAVLFLIVCFVCLAVISKILAYEHETEPDLSMKEFYNLQEDTIQMFVVGSSHVQLGFSPMEAYKQHQITSYNFGTNKQPIELSYHLVKEGLKTQSPEVVIYDVASLFYGKGDVNTARFRYIMDGMPLSLNKIELAACAAKYNSSEKIFAMGEALCPIYYFHDRWKELSKSEFYVNEPVSHLKGQFMRTYIDEMKYDIEKIEAKVAKEIAAGTAKEPTISEFHMSYLLKLKELCEENDIKLLLMTTPTVRWNSLKSNAIKKVCEENQLDFLDLNMPDGELIDYSVDMADGNHVNAYGAKKTTEYFCQYVMENYGVTGKECKEYEDSIKYYDAYDNVLKYELETDFNEYLSLLNENKKDLAIFISANDEAMDGLTAEDIKQLKQLGCKITFDNTYSGNSYISVIDGGKLVHEAAKESALSFKYDLVNGSKVKLASKGLSAGSQAVIDVDGTSYAINSPGLNIVVFDKNSNTVLDSVAFDTHTDERHWYRGDTKDPEKAMYKDYRDWVLVNY